MSAFCVLGMHTIPTPAQRTWHLSGMQASAPLLRPPIQPFRGRFTAQTSRSYLSPKRTFLPTTLGALGNGTEDEKDDKSNQSPSPDAMKPVRDTGGIVERLLTFVKSIFGMGGEVTKDSLWKMLLEAEKDLGKERVEKVKVNSKLAQANEKVLRLESRLNVRGAIEKGAEDLKAELNLKETRVQAILSEAYEKDMHLKDLVKAIAHQYNVCLKDVELCLNNLYHQLSKHVHGVDNTGIIISHREYAAGEIVAMKAILQRVTLRYREVLKTGEERTWDPVD